MLDPQTSLRHRFDEFVTGGATRLAYDPATSDVPRWQDDLRRALCQLLAVDTGPAAAVSAEVLSERDMGGYVRQYVRFTARDGVVIPAYKLLPKGLSAPAPAVVCLHGHGQGKIIPAGFEQDLKGSPVRIEGERDYAVQAVQQGYIALAPDLRGFGELMLPDDLDANRGSSCDQLAFRAAMTGRTLLGMRVIDVMSCVDYLLTDPQVDPTRLICTGQSGGGTATLFSTAIDTRFAISVPSCYFCTFRASIVAMYHCSCNYVHGLLELCEMHDVAGLIAPRPLLVIAGAEDPIFPLPGVQEAYARLWPIYGACEASANLELFVGPEGHRYYKARVWDFVKEHL